MLWPFPDAVLQSLSFSESCRGRSDIAAGTGAWRHETNVSNFKSKKSQDHAIQASKAKILKSSICRTAPWHPTHSSLKKSSTVIQPAWSRRQSKRITSTGDHQQVPCNFAPGSHPQVIKSPEWRCLKQVRMAFLSLRHTAAYDISGCRYFAQKKNKWSRLGSPTGQEMCASRPRHNGRERCRLQPISPSENGIKPPEINECRPKKRDHFKKQKKNHLPRIMFQVFRVNFSGGK